MPLFVLINVIIYNNLFQLTPADNRLNTEKHSQIISRYSTQIALSHLQLSYKAKQNNSCVSMNKVEKNWVGKIFFFILLLKK